jgi:hypothetical protein
MAHYHNIICTTCYAERVPPARARLGYRSCMTCGEKAASNVRHTIAPMSKSNYYYVGDPEMLKQLNPKRPSC